MTGIWGMHACWMGTMVTVLAVVHTFLVSKNLTTNEIANYERYGYLENDSHGHGRRAAPRTIFGWASRSHALDRGCLRNWQNAFCPSPKPHGSSSSAASSGPSPSAFMVEPPSLSQFVTHSVPYGPGAAASSTGNSGAVAASATPEHVISIGRTNGIGNGHGRSAELKGD